jgi:hypothetical protein
LISLFHGSFRWGGGNRFRRADVGGRRRRRRFGAKRFRAITRKALNEFAKRSEGDEPGRVEDPLRAVGPALPAQANETTSLERIDVIAYGTRRPAAESRERVLSWPCLGVALPMDSDSNKEGPGTFRELLKRNAASTQLEQGKAEALSKSNSLSEWKDVCLRSARTRRGLVLR